MSNKERAREYREQLEESRRLKKDKEGWLKAKTIPRPICEDVGIGISGIGERRLQLVYQPCFVEGVAWDVRQHGDDWLLFRSVIEPEVDLANGYSRVEIDSARLKAEFDRIIALRLSIAPDLSGMGGADGELYQLAIVGDLYSAVRFRWWSDPPVDWRPLVDIADAMLEEFGSLSLIETDA